MGDLPRPSMPCSLCGSPVDNSHAHLEKGSVAPSHLRCLQLRSPHLYQFCETRLSVNLSLQYGENHFLRSRQ
jgi:hypothetical protein